MPAPVPRIEATQALRMGENLGTDGDPGEARHVYCEGLRHKPDHIQLRNNLALSLAIAGDSDQAIALLDDLACSLEGGTRVRQNLALTNALAGRDDKARALRSLEGARLAQAVMCACVPPSVALPVDVPVTAQHEAPDDLSLPVPQLSENSAQALAGIAWRKLPVLQTQPLAPALVPPQGVEVINGSKTLIVVNDDMKQTANAAETFDMAEADRARHSPAPVARPSKKHRRSTHPGFEPGRFLAELNSERALRALAEIENETTATAG